MRNLYEYTNPELLDFGLKLITKFLDVNGIPHPSSVTDRQLVASPRGSYGCGVCFYPSVGVHSLPRIIVTSAACAKPSRGYGQRWSFPGFITDRTPVGVLAHEVGHHIDFVLRTPSRELPKSGKVSSYEPNLQESWAESIRLFILNPSILEAVSPARFHYIRKVIGLKRSTRQPAVDRLGRWGASDAILEKCRKKIGA